MQCFTRYPDIDKWVEKQGAADFFFNDHTSKPVKVGHRAANDILKFASLHRMLQVRRVGRHTTPIRPTWQEG